MTIISDAWAPSSTKPVGRHLLGQVSRWMLNLQLVLSIALAVMAFRTVYLTTNLDGQSKKLSWLIEKIVLLGPYLISSLVLIVTKIYGFEERSCVRKPQKSHYSLVSTALVIFVATCVCSSFGPNDSIKGYLVSNLHGLFNNYDESAKARETLDIKEWTRRQTNNILQLDRCLVANQDEMNNVTSDVLKDHGCAKKVDKEIDHQWLKNLSMLLFMTFIIEVAMFPFSSAFISQFPMKFTKRPLSQDNDEGNANNGNNSNNNNNEDDDKDNDGSWDNCDYVTVDDCYVAKSSSNKNFNNKNTPSVTDVAKENSCTKTVAGNKNFNHKRDEHYLDSHKKSKKKHETAYVNRESPNSAAAKTGAMPNSKSPKSEQILKAKTPSKESSKKIKEEQKILKELNEDKFVEDNAPNKQNKVIANESEKNIFNKSPATPFVGKKQSSSTISSKSKTNTPSKSKLAAADACQPKMNREENLETPYYSKNVSRASGELLKQSRKDNVDEGDSAEKNICNSGVRAARRRPPAKTLLNPAANMFNFNFDLKQREEYKVDYGYDNDADTVEGDSDEQTEEENFDETDFNITQNASPLSSASTGDRKGSEGSTSAASGTTKTAVTSAGTSAPPTVATSVASSSAISEVTEKPSRRRKSERKTSKKTSGPRKSKRGKSGEKSRKRPSGDKDKKRRGTSKRKKDKKSKSPNQRSSLESLGSKRTGSKRRRAGETARRGKPFRVSPKRLSELERKFSGDVRGKPFNIDPSRMDELFEKYSDEENRPFRIHEYRMDELKEKYDDIDAKTPYHKKTAAEKKSKSRGKSDKRGKPDRKGKSKKSQKRGGKDKKK